MQMEIFVALFNGIETNKKLNERNGNLKLVFQIYPGNSKF